VDLVVLMGQTVSPDFEIDYATYFNQATAYLKMVGIPWVSTGGLDRDPSVITRSKKVQIDQACGDDTYNGESYTLSYTGRYPQEVPNVGEFTQRLPIFNSDGSKELLSLWFLDS
jgi:hypothetical protein